MCKGTANILGGGEAEQKEESRILGVGYYIPFPLFPKLTTVVVKAGVGAKLKLPIGFS